MPTSKYNPLQALHRVYHERDFRVRVNDYTINMVRQALADVVGSDGRIVPIKADDSECPLCAAGIDNFRTW